MATAAQRIADLERQLADFSADVRDLRAEAFVIKCLEGMRLERQAGVRPTVPPRRPRHLQVVGSDQ
jgi:hypothetical protein